MVTVSDRGASQAFNKYGGFDFQLRARSPCPELRSQCLGLQIDHRPLVGHGCTSVQRQKSYYPKPPRLYRVRRRGIQHNLRHSTGSYLDSRQAPTRPITTSSNPDTMSKCGDHSSRQEAPDPSTNQPRRSHAGQETEICKSYPFTSSRIADPKCFFNFYGCLNSHDDLDSCGCYSF